jgi:Acetyl-CoA hydrolase/transferase C-terminal domain
VRATRQQDRRTISNIVWRYANATVPRHLRDIVVTEYGIADLRGASDRDSIAAMLNLADSQFQPGLLAQAKKARKIEAGYEVPAEFRDNRRDRLEQLLAPAFASGVLAEYPLGTQMTPVEMELARALGRLKELAPSWRRLAGLVLNNRPSTPPTQAESLALARMKLDAPSSLSERAYALLVKTALRAAQRSAQG